MLQDERGRLHAVCAAPGGGVGDRGADHLPAEVHDMQGQERRRHQGHPHHRDAWMCFIGAVLTIDGLTSILKTRLVASANLVKPCGA